LNHQSVCIFASMLAAKFSLRVRLALILGR
jgi:hypothetical protein